MRKSLYGGHLLPFIEHASLLSQILRTSALPRKALSSFGPSSFAKVVIRVSLCFNGMTAIKVEQPLLQSALNS